MGVIKDLDALDPVFIPIVKGFMAALDAAGILYRIEETLRTREVQAAYYAQGRVPLDEVNNYRAKAGLYLLVEKENKSPVTWTLQSEHFSGRAVDIVPLVKTPDRGVIVPWDYVRYADVWLTMGELGIKSGLEWGGTWTPRNSAGVGKDPPHYQKVA